MTDAPTRPHDPLTAQSWRRPLRGACPPVAPRPCPAAGPVGRGQRRLLLCLAAASLACAPAVRQGDAVDIADESAIIVWDEPAKTQHFIRRASFRTAAKDFGFLVPTPTVPELKEASNLAFSFLNSLTGNGVRSRSFSAAAAASAAASRVTVVAQAKVAGYDAVVLDAQDAKALDAWLRQHGYASSPQLVDWVRPYLERRWKITAFKIDRDPALANRAESVAVRMSFKTDAPFFPYREPLAAPSGASGAQERLLRIYMLATTQMEGVLDASTAWPGRVAWSKEMDESARTKLFEHLKLPDTAAPGALWLTEFADASSPRPGASDLTFRATANARPQPEATPAPRRVVLGVREYLTGLMTFIAVVALVAGLLYGAWRVVVPRFRKPRS